MLISEVAAAWAQAILTFVAIIPSGSLAVFVPWRERRIKDKLDARARMDITMTSLDPAGLRLDIRYLPQFMHIGISARVTLLKCNPAVLKAGRPVTNPAPMATGGFVKYETRSFFVGKVGTVRLNLAADRPQPILFEVMYLTPPETASGPISSAKVRIEWLRTRMSA